MKIIAALMVASFLAIIGLSVINENDLKECEKTQSHSTCVYELER